MLKRNRQVHHHYGFLGCLLLLAAGAVAFAFWLHRKQVREDEELDWYLLSDEVESPFLIDAQNWNHQAAGGGNVSVSFTFEDATQARAFMSDLAKAGYSSLLDQKNGIVDIILSGPLSEEDLEDLVRTVTESATAHDGAYQGFVMD